MQLVMSEPQELTLVFPDATLEQVLRTVIDVSGTRCVILTEEQAVSMTERIEDSEARLRADWVSQSELRKRERVGVQKIIEWETKGLQRRMQGNRVMYSLSQLSELRNKRII